ncbi:MAG: radical SAM family heme chaperone HemW [Balneolaceae bacterium]|nr:radical SAM family heme chaperone HemW [Balneolaceae bacterium]
MSGIYLHIPFCKQACSYCDFYFVTRKGAREDYVEALLREIRSYRGTPFAEPPVRTLYLGGGTPSLMRPEWLARVFGALRETFELRLEECTMELNPDDVTRPYLRALRDLGVTRASMGVQSFQPALLEFMNRAHSRDEALEALEALRDTGFGSFTVDLIYGNPGQTLRELAADLDLLLDFEPPHVSAYALTVEPGTRLGKAVDLGRVAEPENETVAEHYERVRERLEKAGLHQYEVSNYSRPGREAVHNSRYWEHANYLGMGPAAHSFWWDGDGARRWEWEANLGSYLERRFTGEPDPQLTESLSPLQLAEERIMMGLRTRVGVSREELADRYGYTLSEKQEELLEERRGRGLVAGHTPELRLTAEGRRLADAVILDLITAH